MEERYNYINVHMFTHTSNSLHTWYTSDISMAKCHETNTYVVCNVIWLKRIAFRYRSHRKQWGAA